MSLIKFVVWSLYACVFLFFFLMLLYFLVCLVFFDFLGFALEKNLWGGSLRPKVDVPISNQVLSMRLLFQLRSCVQIPRVQICAESVYGHCFAFFSCFFTWLREGFSSIFWYGWEGTAVALLLHWGRALQASSRIWEDLLWDPLPGGHPPNRSQLWHRQMPSGISSFGALTFCFPLCCPSENCPGNPPLSF